MAGLDDILAGLQQWSADERRSYIDSMSSASGEDNVHPLFMTSSPSEAAVAASPVLSALTSMAYDEAEGETPEGMAAASKARGNAAYARGPDGFGHALKHYFDALEHAARARDEDQSELIGQVWGNIAAIYLARGKYISTLSACEKSLRANPRAVKVLWRAAKACLPLGRATAALGFAQLGQSIEPGNAALATLVAEAQAAIAVQERNAAATRTEIACRITQIEAVRAAVRERHMAVGPCLYKHMRRTGTYPHVDGSGVVHWPVLLLYPQHHQSDWIDDVSEVTPLSDVLEYVLPNDGPTPPWDREHEYRAANVDVFFLSNPCKATSVDTAWQDYIADAERLGLTSSCASTTAAAASASGAGSEPDEVEVNWGAPTRMVRIPSAAPLMLPLVHASYVTADVPVLYVVPRSCDFYREMRRQAGGRFTELTVPELPPPPE